MVGELTEHMQMVRTVIVHQSTLNGKGDPTLHGRLYMLIALVPGARRPP
jgi:hypothetical protein